MTTLTNRQIDILRIVQTLKRPNTRQIADKLGSPNRLSALLTELVEKRCLHFEAVGKEHFYTIKKKGLEILTKHEGDSAATSVDRLGEMNMPSSLVKVLNRLKSVRLSWCSSCGGTDLAWSGFVSVLEQDGEEERQVERELAGCKKCDYQDLMRGTLKEYEAFLIKRGLVEKRTSLLATPS